MNAGEFDLLQTAAAGMDAQRAALDLAARNVAASQADGASFERLVPRYAVAADPGASSMPDGDEPPEPSDPPDDGGSDDVNGGDDASLAIRYLGATAERGVPVDTVTEMVSVLDAQRAFEANASVFDIGKRLAERTIDMGRLQ